MTDTKVHSIGTSLLAMMVALVGILAMMLVLSHCLQTYLTDAAGAGC